MLFAGLSNSIFASGGPIVIVDTIGELGFRGAMPSNFDQSGDEFLLGNAGAGASDEKHRSHTAAVFSPLSSGIWIRYELQPYLVYSGPANLTAQLI
jgi:hypothetical protein